MNNEYLERAKKVVPDAKTLILLASRRATELAYGMRPMVRCKDENHLIAAREAAKRENGEIRMRHNHPANEE